MKSILSKKTLMAVMVVLGCLVARLALASSNDMDLSSLDGSVEGHIQGDWGRLVAYVALGIGILIAGAKQNYYVLLGCLVVLLAIGFGPDIIDGVTS